MPDLPSPVSPVKRYGVAVVGRKYPFWYEAPTEDDPDRLDMIELRTRRSLSFEEHVAYTRQRSVIASIANTIGRDVARALQVVGDDKQVAAKAEEWGVDRGAALQRLMDEITEKITRIQGEQWERTQGQVLSLVNPLQHDAWIPIMQAADPAQVNELLADMEREVIERIQVDTEAAAAVDPTLPGPPSGSSPTPTSGPDSDSTE